MKHARSEARKQARIKRLEKAVELQMNLEDRAAARRLMQELAEIERDRIRWVGRFTVQVRPEKPASRTSPVKKRLMITPMTIKSDHDTQRVASSWVIDDRGMRGVIWQQSYLGRKSQRFYRGAARDNWEYDVRDEAMLLDAQGEPIIISNMGDDWVEIGTAWQAMEDASTRKNAKIQIRAIAPFDADMSQREMVAALTHFCETILDPLGLPYSAVIHGSPEGGDERNFHPHLAFSLRPMRRIEPYCWEVADEVRGELDGKDGVQMLRHLWAHSMSDAAEKAQRNMRYTGLGYGARGLDLEPGTHLGEARAAMVARGGHVWAHERNRITSARNAARRAVHDADKKIAALTKIRDAALVSIAAEREGAKRVKRLTAVGSVIAKAPLRSSERRRVGPVPAIPAHAKRPAEHRPLVATGAIRFVPKQHPSALVSSIVVERANTPAKRLLSTTRPPQRPASRLISYTPAGKFATPLTSSAPPAQRPRLSRSGAVCAAPPTRMTIAMAHQQVDRLKAANSAPFAVQVLASSSPRPSTSPAKPVLIPSAAIATDASFRANIDELLLALGIARAKRDKQEAAARRRAREADPDWIAPFETDGAPTIALRDLLLTVARAPTQLKIAEDGRVDARRAAEPVRDLLDNWREDAVHPLVCDVVARGNREGRDRWPAAIADLMEAHDRLRASESIRIPAEPISERSPSVRPHDPIGAGSALRKTQPAPTPAERATDTSAVPPRTSLSHAAAMQGDEDRARLDKLARIDAYVADYGGGRSLEIEYPARKAIGAEIDWLARSDVQQALAAIRAEQQRIVAATVGEADRRPLDFAKSGVSFWPRDLDPAHLARLDRWADDPGFQHDMFAVEQRIEAAHAQRDRDRRARKAARQQSVPPAKPSALIADGFGGLRDTPAPVCTDMGNGVRVAAFDQQTGKPTEQLLMLLKLAGEHPHKIVFAADAKLMAMPSAPALLATLLHGWRHDERIADLVTATVCASRTAGRAVWPAEIAAAVRAYTARYAKPGGRPPTDPSHGLSR